MESKHLRTELDSIRFKINSHLTRLSGYMSIGNETLFMTELDAIISELQASKIKIAVIKSSTADKGKPP